MIHLQGRDDLISCGKYSAEMTCVARVCTIDLFIYFEYVYIMHCCWFFRDYVFNDVGYVIIKGGEVRKWFFEDIYIYMLYITLLTFWFDWTILYIYFGYVYIFGHSLMWDTPLLIVGSWGLALLSKLSFKWVTPCKGEWMLSAYIYMQYVYISY
jgi:hypothetical protein